MKILTDEQIKQVLKNCNNSYSCVTCLLHGDEACGQIHKIALDLINRKEAEIERLKEYEEIRPVGCPNCSRGNFSNSKFCSHCGTKL